MTRPLLALVMVGTLVLAGCVQAACACVASVTVFGAASLSDALTELKQGFTSSYGGPVHVAISTGSSAALRTQIEQGASADVFLSADTSNPAALVDLGLVDGSIVAFATNHLVIVVPAANPADITSPADIARPGVRIVAASAEVPITKYAEQAIGQLAARPEYGQTFASNYELNIVTREENVGAVLAKVVIGEGDAAIVYASDALGADVATVQLPAAAVVTATYSGVVLTDVRSPRAAHAFLDWVRGQGGQTILARYGFGPPT